MAKTTEQVVKPGRRYWTAYTDPEGTSEPSDPLRFDMYAQRLGNVLLPGITNRTERLRYLSMVCAGIATTSRGATGTLREQRREFLPFERGWALAMTIAVDGELKGGTDDGFQRALRPEFRGLRGANRVLAHYRTVRERDALSPTGYTLLKSQDAQGGLGAYLVTLRHFGFVQAESIALTALGRELADAFNPALHGAPLTTLTDQRAVKRTKLQRLGDALAIGAPTDVEQRIARAVIFENPQSRVSDCVGRMRAASPGARDARSLLQGIARRDGDEIERGAQYALDFDPFRVSLLQVFAGLGRQLNGRPGSTRLAAAMTDEIEAAAEATHRRARRLESNRELSGLEPVSALAREIAAGNSPAATVRAMVAFHRREGRSWITNDQPDSYVVGRHGSFDEPADAFNGYTVGRAMQLLADTEAVA